MHHRQRRGTRPGPRSQARDSEEASNADGLRTDKLAGRRDYSLRAQKLLEEGEGAVQAATVQRDMPSTDLAKHEAATLEDKAEAGAGVATQVDNRALKTEALPKHHCSVRGSECHR